MNLKSIALTSILLYLAFEINGDISISVIFICCAPIIANLLGFADKAISNLATCAAIIAAFYVYGDLETKQMIVKNIESIQNYIKR